MAKLCMFVVVLYRFAFYCRNVVVVLNFSGEEAVKANTVTCSLAFDSCDSETWDYVDMQQLMCALI